MVFSLFTKTSAVITLLALLAACGVPSTTLRSYDSAAKAREGDTRYQATPAPIEKLSESEARRGCIVGVITNDAHLSIGVGGATVFIEAEDRSKSVSTTTDYEGAFAFCPETETVPFGSRAATSLIVGKSHYYQDKKQTFEITVNASGFGVQTKQVLWRSGKDVRVEFFLAKK